MKKIINGITLLCLSVSVSWAIAEPRNFYDEQQELIEYYQSGQYEREIYEVAEKAQLSLKEALTQKSVDERLAIVLDIDETAISNIELILKAYNLAFLVGDSVPNSYFNSFQYPYNDPAIKPILKLYQYAIENNVAVFFISGRFDAGRNDTEKNLVAVGYNKWSGLFLRTSAQKTLSAVDFKTASRKTVTDQGYKIVMSLGDQQSDISGDYVGEGFKLPNPYYFTQ